MHIDNRARATAGTQETKPRDSHYRPSSGAVAHFLGSVGLPVRVLGFRYAPPQLYAATRGFVLCFLPKKEFQYLLGARGPRAFIVLGALSFNVLEILSQLPASI